MFFYGKKKKKEKLAALQLALKESAFPFWSNWPAFFLVYFAQYSSIGEVTNKEDFLFCLLLHSRRVSGSELKLTNHVFRKELRESSTEDYFLFKCVSFGSKWGVIFLGDR